MGPNSRFWRIGAVLLACSVGVVVVLLGLPSGQVEDVPMVLIHVANSDSGGAGEVHLEALEGSGTLEVRTGQMPPSGSVASTSVAAAPKSPAPSEEPFDVEAFHVGLESIYRDHSQDELILAMVELLKSPESEFVNDLHWDCIKAGDFEVLDPPLRNGEFLTYPTSKHRRAGDPMLLVRYHAGTEATEEPMLIRTTIAIDDLSFARCLFEEVNWLKRRAGLN